MGISELNFLQLSQELRIPVGHYTAEAHDRRVDTLNEAKSLPKGEDLLTNEIYSERKLNPHDTSKWSPVFSSYYEDKENGLIIGVFKPGKEAGSDYRMTNYLAKKERVKNPHDMFPVILQGNENLASKITLNKAGGTRFYTPFTLEHVSDIFDYIILQNKGRITLELLGAIITRMAFMLDHEEIAPGCWRLKLPQMTISNITKRLPFIEFNQGDFPRKISTVAFLYWLDILAINEEIKVDGKGHRNLIEKRNVLTDKGRTNTLLTYSYCIAAMLQRRSVGKFTFGYNRSNGIFPLKHSDIMQVFPILDGNIKQYWKTLGTREIGWLYP